MTLVIAHIHPELLGTYGDVGNVDVLAFRARLRGIDVEVVDVTAELAVPVAADLYVIGGGEDTPQLTSLLLLRKARGLSVALDRGASLLAICAGLQLIGESLPGRDGATMAGLGLVDATTVRSQESRCVGEILVRPTDVSLPLITGFENHQNRTRLGAAVMPLGLVVRGHGNGIDGADGLLTAHIVATYAHGPVMALNPQLADFVLGRIVGPLGPADEPFGEALARERSSATARRRWTRR
jgi:lipid II isoglutaminyl synthase (glutamine-hydrolysing)